MFSKSEQLFFCLYGLVTLLIAALWLLMPQEKDVSPSLIKLTELGLHKQPLRINSIAELELYFNGGWPSDSEIRNARKKRHLSPSERDQFLDFLAKASHPRSDKNHPRSDDPSMWEVSTDVGVYFIITKALFSPDGKTGPWVEVVSEGLNETRLNYLPIYEMEGTSAASFIELLRQR